MVNADLDLRTIINGRTRSPYFFHAFKIIIKSSDDNSLDCRESHMKKNRLFVCMSVCIKVKRTSILETHNS